ncbi:MAG TPA: alanine--tRNA ligase [Deltaproteobacteria bacterium]|nr:alanine--tRNA ligase [Deltaproteobacteria bacterium]
MRGSDIRTMFLDYFQDKGHTLVPSSSLVPSDDPTLLFTNAGMVQFKATFLGTQKRPYSRATSSQKCVRAGGKHNDLENVGRTARHHTFFEMLGNFSFGDYFKRGAIEYAWELLVDRMGLDPSRLYVSVHHTDDEAYDIWNRTIGVASDRILRLGDKDNFWAMGDTGPCGPCSEIIFDQGPGVGCARPECSPGECDCDRYLEIWNLVFMQFNKDEQGNLTRLPAPNIDTGMGLERITAVLQGVTSNYHTDLFTGLIGFIGELSGVSYGNDGETDVSIRVVADHARACAFLVSDGVLPSNEGRGYVLRRIIRRAARHGKMLGFDRPFLHRVAMRVASDMSPAYPELAMRSEFVDKVIASEEERFLKTLDRGLGLLDEIVRDLKANGKTLMPGREVFVLYDTFGFPVDLTADIARKEGIEIDTAGFEAEMEIQREKARGASSFAGTGLESAWSAASGSRFVGYDTLETDSLIVEMRSMDASSELEAAEEGEELLVATAVTPFYGESGGQVGDTGEIVSPSGRARVLDAVKTESDTVVHRVRVVSGRLELGQGVTLRVDAHRRKAVMRHHSATHLLHRALREVLGEHVHQAGSLVDDSRLRFDFTHFSALSPEELAHVENLVNQYVKEDLPITTEILSRDEAVSRGAMALFTEKYGDTVRLVSMGDVSRELCGGTHCSSTGQIGMVKVVSVSSISAGLRRIEAVAGFRCLEHARSLSSLVAGASQSLRCSPEEIEERIKGLLAKIKDQEATIEELTVKLATGTGPSADEREYDAGGLKVVVKKVQQADTAQMRQVGDRIKERISKGAVLLYTDEGDKATFMIMATKGVEGVMDAGRVMKKAMAAVGGRGGGKELFAQGGAGADSTGKVIEIFLESAGVKP